LRINSTPENTRQSIIRSQQFDRIAERPEWLPRPEGISTIIPAFFIFQRSQRRLQQAADFALIVDYQNAM